MTPELLAALKTALADPDNEWEVQGASTYGHGEHPSRTVQLHSPALGIHLVAMIETVLEENVPVSYVTIFKGGFNFSVQDTELQTLIETLATEAGEAADAALIQALG